MYNIFYFHLDENISNDYQTTVKNWINIIVSKGVKSKIYSESHSPQNMTESSSFILISPAEKGIVKSQILKFKSGESY
jgi:hypothetical protein